MAIPILRTPPLRSTGTGRLPLIPLPVQRWYCPACKAEDVTRLPPNKAYSHMHICPKMRYLTTPMLQVGTKGKHELKEREAYVGKEMVRLDPERRRPVMNITTTRDRGADGRDEGQDCTVFAPTASAGLE